MTYFKIPIFASPKSNGDLKIVKCGSSSVGRASAFQAECREFDPRLPLLEKSNGDLKIVKCGSSSVGRASAFQAECREFDPRLPLLEKSIRRFKNRKMRK